MKIRNPFKEFLNIPAEWHALWIGIWRVFWPVRIDKLPEHLRKDVDDEYHYCLGGYAFGSILKIAILLFVGHKLF